MVPAAGHALALEPHRVIRVSRASPHEHQNEPCLFVSSFLRRYSASAGEWVTAGVPTSGREDRRVRDQ